MSVLSKLFDSKDIKNIKTDLFRLNSIQEGLGDDAVQHVLCGDRDSVLAAVTQHQNKPAEILRFDSYWTDKAVEKAMQARWHYLHLGHFDPKIWMRYGQLLIAAKCMTKSAPGTEQTPSWLRIILYQFLYLHSFYSFRQENSTTAEDKFSLDNLYTLASADKSVATSSSRKSIELNLPTPVRHKHCSGSFYENHRIIATDL